ncbi:MAG: NAD(P)H-dependent oxidoreductase subunit E [Myxococcales bacterium]|nr:NAD(P)H-dependent oxidoreductase subunit E [Myxococcales bacterium]
MTVYRPPRIIQHLNELMERHGWLRDDDLRNLALELGEPLHRVEGVASFYPLYRREAPPEHVIQLCRDLTCSMCGSEEELQRIREMATAHERTTGERVAIERVSCLGRCEHAPAALLAHEPITSGPAGGLSARLQKRMRGEPESETPEPPPATRQCDPYADDPGRHYETVQALGRALSEDPEAPAQRVLAELDAAGLRGMGGAGFPTGRKWGFVRAAGEPGSEKFVICNADESEPGTFKDRAIMAHLPHLVWEGMMIAALVVGAQRCVVYIRHEYEPEREALAAARARADVVAGALGLALEIFVSPGGYIQGEETALLEALEDRRGEPRNKPPFPGVEGLFGRPTLINNVETLAMTTAIVARGASWWKGQGANGCHGLKFISLSGDVARPGVYEVPMGTTVRELIARAGGVAGGRAVQAFLPGGASSAFLPADKLDTPMDFDRLRDAGSTLGSGGVVIVAEGRDLLALGLSLTRFFRNESCGKCVPCRVGSQKAVTLLEELRSGAAPLGRRRSLALLEQLDATMAQTSICGLGQVALLPAMSLFRNFPALAEAAADAGAAGS